MRKQAFIFVATAGLLLLAANQARAQAYSNAVQALQPAAYWPLQETVAPPFGAYIATNLGTAGAGGNGFYETWFQSWNTGTNILYYQTNNIQHVAGAIGDGDTAIQCTNSAAGTGRFVVFPRDTNGVPNAAITIVPPFSVEFWANPVNVTGGVKPIINQGRIPVQNGPEYGYSTNINGFCIGQFQPNFFFGTWNGRSGANNPHKEITAPITAGAWQHIVATFDGTTMKLFKNGVQASTATLTVADANALGELYVADLISPLIIGTGSIIGGANGGSEFDGGIDEVAVYPQALDVSQISAHYAAASATDATYKNTVLADSPTIYVRLDDPAFNSSNYPDRSTYPVAHNYGLLGAAGNGAYQPGTTPGAAGPAFSGFGGSSRAVAFNGFSGAVDIGAGSLPPELNTTSTAPMTVAAWFQGNPADVPSRFQEIVSHGNSSWRISLDATVGGPRFNPGNGPELQFTAQADMLTNGFFVNDRNWHFIAGVSDGLNDYLYIDGVLAKSGASVGANVSVTTDALIGGSPSVLVPVYNGSQTSQPRYFDGQIAQVAIFTNALSAAQIQQLYTAAGVPPTITSQPQSISTNAGSVISLNVGAKGSGTLAYQWYKNSSPISAATSSSLAFNPLVLNNAGSYFAVVTNSYGSATSSVASITVIGPPVVQQQSPTSARVFVGTAPTLRATASGSPPISYQWTKDGSAISGATASSYQPSTATTGTHTYSCNITNIYSTNAASAFSAISVTVLAAPTAPFPQTVLADHPLDYFRLDETPDNGSGNNGVPAYDYAGGLNAAYTNCTIAQPGYTSGFTVQSDPSETAAVFGGANSYAGNVSSYLNFGVTNGGNAAFSIEAWVNGFGQFTNAGIVCLGYGNGGEQFCLDTGGSGFKYRFFVRDASGTSHGASGTTALADGLWHHLAVVCDEANGHIYLYIDGTNNASGTISANSGLLASSLPLSIGSRQQGNGTEFNAQFSGSIDDVAVYGYALTANQVMSHYLAAGIAPVITLQPTNAVANEGGVAQFFAAATGTAPLAYQWYDVSSGSVPLAGQTTATLTLSNVPMSSSGKSFQLLVTNVYGQVLSDTPQLTIVAGPPNISVDLQPLVATNWTGTPVTYAVSVDGTAPFRYQWKQNGLSIASATNSSYTVLTLVGANSYQVAVTNAQGYALSSVATNVGILVPSINPADYTYKLKIKFSGYNRGETLRDFPVLVRLGTNVAGFAYAQLASPTGGDLRFADASGTRSLPYEIDEWNDTNGASTIWVQVPQLSGTNDFIWAYWGNPGGVALPQYATNGAVWVPPQFENLPPYQIVYHLKESALPFLDSTLQHPATNGDALLPTAGIVGTAGSFEGSHWLDAGTNDVGDAFTLSAWVNIPTGTSDIDALWAAKPGGFGTAGYALFVNTYLVSDQKIDLATGNGTAGNESTSGAGTVPFGAWHLVTAAINRTNGTANLYLDGDNVANSSSIRTDFPTQNDLKLGQLLNGAFDFRGAMDEARVQSGVNSSNWVWASWATVAQNSTFASYSSVTSSAVTLTFQVLGNNLILSWPQGTLQSAPAVTGPYNGINGATSPRTNQMTGTQFYRVRVH